jgi:hypothetical protein
MRGKNIPDTLKLIEMDSEWTLKYFTRTGKSIVLEAANPKYPPIKPREELRRRIYKMTGNINIHNSLARADLNDLNAVPNCCQYVHNLFPFKIKHFLKG